MCMPNKTLHSRNPINSPYMDPIAGKDPPPTPPKLPIPAMEGKAFVPHKHSQVHVWPLEATPVPVATLALPFADADAVAIDTTATVYVVKTCVGLARAVAFALEETAICSGVEAFAADETAIWSGVEAFAADETAI